MLYVRTMTIICWHQNNAISSPILCHQLHRPLPSSSLFDSLCPWYCASICPQSRSIEEMLRITFSQETQGSLMLFQHMQRMMCSRCAKSVFEYKPVGLHNPKRSSFSNTATISCLSGWIYCHTTIICWRSYDFLHQEGKFTTGSQNTVIKEKSWNHLEKPEELQRHHPCQGFKACCANGS